MPAYKVRFKLEGLKGLEVEIEGDRGEIPDVRDVIREQIANMLPSPANLLPGQNDPPKVKVVNPEGENHNGDNGNNKNGRKRGRRAVQSRVVPPGDAPVIDWKHSPEQWGHPKHEWSVRSKVIWLLYVAQQAAAVKDMTAPSIVATFKKHFREAGPLHPPLVKRELSRAKTSSLVAEDTVKNPTTWYLVEPGTKLAVQLVTEAKGGGGQ